jgi:anti-anti-sigma factor
MPPDLQPQPFSLSTSPISDDGVLISVHGELDMASADELTAAIGEHLGSHQRLEVDLAEVAFMDSTGLSALLAAQEAATRAERSFALRPGLSEAVQRLFEVTRITEAFTFVAPG